MDVTQCNGALFNIYLDVYGTAARRNILCFRGGAICPTPEEMSFLYWQLRETLGEESLIKEMASCDLSEEETISYLHSLPDPENAVEDVIREHIHGAGDEMPLLTPEAEMECDFIATTESMASVLSLYADKVRKCRTAYSHP